MSEDWYTGIVTECRVPPQKPAQSLSSSTVRLDVPPAHTPQSITASAGREQQMHTLAFVFTFTSLVGILIKCHNSGHEQVKFGSNI